MKKTVFCILFCVCTFITVHAQKTKKINISVGPEIGYAANYDALLGGLGLGLGISASAEYFFLKKFSVEILVGYSIYLAKSFMGFDKPPDLNVIPIRVGTRYYFNSFHAGVEIGVGLLNGEKKFLKQDGTAFSYSPQIGYKFKISKAKAIDAILKYDVYLYDDRNKLFTSGGLKVAYVF